MLESTSIAVLVFLFIFIVLVGFVIAGFSRLDDLERGLNSEAGNNRIEHEALNTLLLSLQGRVVLLERRVVALEKTPEELLSEAAAAEIAADIEAELFRSTVTDNQEQKIVGLSEALYQDELKDLEKSKAYHIHNYKPEQPEQPEQPKKTKKTKKSKKKGDAK